MNPSEERLMKEICSIQEKYTESVTKSMRLEGEGDVRGAIEQLNASSYLVKRLAEISERLMLRYRSNADA